MNEELEESVTILRGVADLVMQFQREYVDYLTTYHTLLDDSPRYLVEQVRDELLDYRSYVESKSVQEFAVDRQQCFVHFISELIYIVETGLKEAK